VIVCFYLFSFSFVLIFYACDTKNKLKFTSLPGRTAFLRNCRVRIRESWNIPSCSDHIGVRSHLVCTRTDLRISEEMSNQIFKQSFNVFFHSISKFRNFLINKLKDFSIIDGLACWLIMRSLRKRSKQDLKVETILSSEFWNHLKGY